RCARGAFASLDDFAERIDPRLVNRRQIESLAAGGALDALVAHRAEAYACAEPLLAAAAQAADTRASGQGGLFGGDVIAMPVVMRPRIEPWPVADAMAREKEAFGFYFSVHPVSRFAVLTRHARARTFAELARTRCLSAGASGRTPPGDHGGLRRIGEMAHLAARQSLPYAHHVRPIGPISCQLF
ncbi:MAG: hypothetical protein MUF41_02625, partial [Sphingopyxis sp.]|nr:hypothetical protein [Sphingopyxis sp.]